MASQPGYASTVKVGIGALSVANTNRDGTGTIETVFTAGASGSRIDRIVIKAKGNTTAGVIRLFIYNGTTSYLWREIAVSAITVSATVAGFESAMSSNNAADIGFLPLVLPVNYILKASTHNAETFNVIAIGGDL